MLKEAEILRDDFLVANDGDQDKAFLAACQLVLNYAAKIDQLKSVSSVGFTRRGV